MYIKLGNILGPTITLFCLTQQMVVPVVETGEIYLQTS